MRQFILVLFALTAFIGVNAQTVTITTNVINITSTNFTVQCMGRASTPVKLGNARFKTTISNNSNVTGVTSFSLGANYATYSMTNSYNATTKEDSVSLQKGAAATIISSSDEELWQVTFSHNGSTPYSSIVTITLDSLSDTTATAITNNGFSPSTQILPVKLLYFEASGNALNWATATQNNKDYFGIEQSYDGINFFQIGNVKAKGVSTSTNHYSFSHNTTSISAPNDIEYFRLRIVDLNGSYEYSDIAMSKGMDNDELSATTNGKELKVHYSNKDLAQAEISVVSIEGSTMYTSTIYGHNTVGINIAMYKAGIYIISVSEGDKHKVIKVVIL